MFPPIVPNIVAGHGWLSISDLDLFLAIQHNGCLLDPCHSYWLIKTWYFSTQSVFRKLSWNKTNAAPRLCSSEFQPLTSRSDFNELSTKPTNFPCNFLHQLSLHCQRSHFRVSYQIKRASSCWTPNYCQISDLGLPVAKLSLTKGWREKPCHKIGPHPVEWGRM